MNQIRQKTIVVLLLCLMLVISSTPVLAVTVPELPDDNLIENPWFRNGNQPSLAGWTDAAGSNVYWSLSQKDSNPSPDAVQGTSARFAFGSGQGGGVGVGGVDAVLYQVVKADPTLTQLNFKIHWVTGWIDRAAVTIYGGESESGPWTAVWTPLEVTQATSSQMAWTETDYLATVIETGFPNYKVELFARYPEGRQQGAKFTGVYFSIAEDDGTVPEAAPETAVEATPTTAAENAASGVATRPPRLRATQTAAALATNTPPSAPTETPAELAAVPANTEAAPTEPAAPAPTETAVPPTTAPQIEPTPETPIQQTPEWVYMAVIAFLLVLVVVFGLGWMRSARTQK